MTGRRICAGYYRRYDRRVVYVVSLATDADTGEETAVWTAYPFVDVPKYYTSSKKSFCAFIEVKRRASVGRFVNGNDHRWMKHTTPESISRPIPITHTQKISVSTTTSTETNIASA